MRKADIIKKIKDIINEWGSFTTATIRAESSPCIASLGRTCQLAEQFLEHKVEVVTYTNDEETGSHFVKYEDIKAVELKQILELAKQYKEQCIEEESEN